MDRLIRAVQSWGVPLGMTLAYGALALTSDTTNTGKAWMAIGLAFVFVLWWMFRLLTEHAALSRAVAVGEATKVLELTERALHKRKRPAARAQYLVYRALAHELRGEWPKALATLDEMQLDRVSTSSRATWTLLAASVRIAALVETAKVAEARRVLDQELLPATKGLDQRLHASSYLFAGLARGRVAFAEAKAAEARTELQKIVDDIRAGNALRATAMFYLARLVEPEDAAAATRLRADLAKLVPAETWLVATTSAAA